MAKQTFTVGQVLTAAQLTSLQQTAMLGGAASAKTASYTLVAADAGTTISMTSTSATTITVNTGLFAAGDTVFIQNLGSGNLTITAGTATVATAGSLILPQNDAGILYFVSTSSSVFYDFIQVGAASPLTTKGDLYTFSTSDTRLGVGANGTILTADSAEATGLKWAAAASGGGMTLLSTTTLSGASTTISSISGAYNNLQLIIYDANPSTTAGVYIKPNALSSLVDFSNATNYGSTSTVEGYRASNILWNGGQNLANSANGVMLTIFQYANTNITYKPIHLVSRTRTTASPQIGTINMGGSIELAAAITSLQIGIDSGTLTGTALLYGVK